MSDKLWLSLGAQEAVLTSVGGKGESLAKLARCGLPVPGGFHLTTAAYRRFVEATSAADEIAAIFDSHGPVSARSAAERIQPLFDTAPIPREVRTAIAEAYAELGESPRVAVRSSATAEDLPQASFAGQMDSYLNVSGVDHVEQAVRRCWASLWTERAIEYRTRVGIPVTDVTLAVVVQNMVEADAAGVMFTADPVTGNRDRTVINAAWGLGESLVSGYVTPDSYTVADKKVVERHIGDKAVETLRTPDGTEEREVPEQRRTAAVLDGDRAVELAVIGAKVAGLYRQPMDIEWAVADGRFHLVQARPITTLPSLGAEREIWNDSELGDYLWTSANLGEAIPSVMTPFTSSVMKTFMAEAMALSRVGEHRLSGNIGGRFYMNLTVLEAVGQALGIQKLMYTTLEQVFGSKPPGMVNPSLPMSRLAILRSAIGDAYRFKKMTGQYKKHFYQRVAEFPSRCESSRAKIARAADTAALHALWESDVDVLFRDGARLLAVGGRIQGSRPAMIRSWLRKYVDEADTNALQSGVHGSDGDLASLGPLQGLAQLSAGEIDRETFVVRWGHRLPDEFEVSIPRPAEDPEWIDRRLAELDGAISVPELLARQESARADALDRFAKRHPRKLRDLHKRLDEAAITARGRESGRSEAIRAYQVLRSFMVRAGELTGAGADVFFLDVPELLRLLAGEDAVLAVVSKRRATYEHYRSLPAYPAVIRGAFDPEKWAANPDRRVDVFDASRPDLPTNHAITGAAGSPGIAEGIAVVADGPEDGDRLGPGDILITKVTNIGWTPIFPRAAAVVTDVGAVLSHAAIVARELGIPAVVGCGVATMNVCSGDRVRVNGDTGTVEVLSRAAD